MSVIVPAHDEEAVLGRLLARLPSRLPPNGSGDDGLQVIVVCNGCTDRTATVAAGFAGVQVVEIPEPSKARALRAGDRVAGERFPRVYLDADVEIDGADLLRLVEPLRSGRALATAPARDLPRTGVSRWVRWYYDVWEQLPQVRDGIFGRGVIALSEAGYRRIAALPPLLSDDLAMSSAFTPAERLVVDQARVVVHPPRTWADLIRRRARVATGTAQAYGGGAELATDSRTGVRDLLGLARSRPALAAKLPVFLAAAVLARRRAARALRRADYTTWLRDESSRRAAPGN